MNGCYMGVHAPLQKLLLELLHTGLYSWCCGVELCFISGLYRIGAVFLGLFLDGFLIFFIVVEWFDSVEPGVSSIYLTLPPYPAVIHSHLICTFFVFYANSRPVQNRSARRIAGCACCTTPTSTLTLRTRRLLCQSACKSNATVSSSCFL